MMKRSPFADFTRLWATVGRMCRLVCSSLMATLLCKRAVQPRPRSEKLGKQAKYLHPQKLRASAAQFVSTNKSVDPEGASSISADSSREPKQKGLRESAARCRREKLLQGFRH